MKILRLGKNGMVRSQKGTWFTSNHFRRIYVQKWGSEWRIFGEAENDAPTLGIFNSEEEAQSELDSLFTCEERQCF